MTRQAAKRSGKSVVQRLRTLVQESIEAVADRAVAHPHDEFVLQAVNPVRIVAAYSGGRDSSALLEALVRIRDTDRNCRIAQLMAVHVHHGLSQHADEWVEHAKAQCARWRVDLRVERVYVNAKAGGVEAAARQARYRALMKVARQVRADVIMTAHHQDDRIETFLIQWIRGAGPEGLSAMSPVRALQSVADAQDDAPIVLARPWLDVSGSDIAEFAKRARLSWVEDDSNSDTRYLRNLIRNDMLGHLDQARPGWRAAAARSVALVAQSAEVLRTVGQDDCAHCAGSQEGSLNIAALLSLPVARQSLCLRTWLTHSGLRAPSQARLRDMLRQLRDSQSDTRMAIRIESMEMRRWGDDVVLRVCETAARSNDQVRDIVWTGQSEVSLGVWGGVLRFEMCGPDEDGIDAKRLRQGPVQVRPRRGGEKLKLHRFRPSRNLKHLYQAQNVPAFERPLLPLVWVADDLIFAAGLGMDVREYADRVLTPERVRLVWVPDKPLLSIDHAETD